MDETIEQARSRVAHAINGMVAGGFAIEYDLTGGAVSCERCGTVLTAGNEVTVALICYEGHTWEPYSVFCRDHGVDTVAEAVGETSAEGAVVAATLEPTGYRDPVGDHHPDAVSLGGVDVLSYSPLRYD